MKKIILFVIFLALVGIANAQSDFRDGYIITLSGDTIRGTLDYRRDNLMYRSCDFIKSGTNETNTYLPVELHGLRFKGDKFFISREVQTQGKETELVFLEVLISGRVSLYKYSKHFFIEKDNEGLIELTKTNKEVTVNGKKYIKESNKYKGILLYSLRECNAIGDKIAKLEFGERALLNLIEEYNTCVNAPNIVYQEKLSWAKVSCGLAFGFSSSSIEFKNNFNDYPYLLSGFDPANSGTIGVSFALESPRVNERLSLHAEVFYLNTQYISYNVVDRNGTIDRYDVLIDLNILKIPFSIRYSLSGKNFRPYFNVGVSSINHLNTKSELILETEFNRIIETTEGKALQISKNQIGFWGGLGLTKPLGKTFVGLIELRIEKTSGISVDPLLESSILNFTLLVGLTF